MKKVVVTLVTMVVMSGSAWAEKTIVFATDATRPPMEVVDSNKNIVAYSGDLLINKGIETVKANGIDKELKKKWIGR